MENEFGIDNKIVIQALKHGIIVKSKYTNEFNEVKGFLCLTFIAQLGEFAFTFGTCALDAGYALVKNYNSDWKLKVELNG